jgi:hypothetical protein
MIDRSLARGLALIAIALAFGLEALRYPIGRLSQSGPGLFPLMVSGLLLLIGVSVVVRSRFVARVPLDFNVKNIGIILVSLCAFALVSTLVNMTLGIAALVFIASFAGKSYSLTRNLQITAGLLLVAFAFQKLLGFNLPLY